MSARRFLRAAGAIGLALAATAHAGDISPALRASIHAAPPGHEIAVIITLSDRVDESQFQTANHESRDGRLVRALRSKADATQAPLHSSLHSVGGHDLKQLWLINGVAVTLPASGIEFIARFPGVASVRADLAAAAPPVAAAAPAPPEWNLATVHASDVWSLGIDGTGIVVANLDTGVDAQHPDLASRWRGGTNSWYDPNGEHPSPYDASGHGTQTMSLMVGGSAGGSSIGLAPGARWIAAKIFNDAGTTTYSRIHLAFQWLLDPDNNPATNDAPDVVNLSWGLVGTAGQCITEFDADLRILKAAGIALAIAAGNDGPAAATSLSPANNASGFSAGAVDASLGIASFSARGPSACTGSTYPSLAAPGVNVLTADLSFGGLPFYITVSGTSYAAPHVAGAIALLLEAFPSAPVADVEAALTQSAADLGLPGPDHSFGAGLLDALAAYKILLARFGSAPKITSTPATTATVGTPYSYVVTATDASGSAITYSLDVSPPGMTLEPASGATHWTPLAAQLGANAVTVRATNAIGAWAQQSFTIVVSRPNTAPVAANDSYAVLQGTALTVAAPGILANDSDAEHDPLSAALVAGPTHGTLALAANGSFTFRANAGYSGPDSFTYRAFDGALYGNVATVSIAINPNHPPVAVNDAATAKVRTTNAYTPVAINVVANDSDPDGNLNPASVSITSAPNKGGAATANANGTVSYTPKLNYRGTETFRYTVRDSLGAVSNQATVTATVP
jgi:hypothetical protein